MNLIRYIQGIRKGSEINRLEREAMEDFFLSDALEGYDKVQGEHEIWIKRMQDKISARTRSSKHTLRYWSIAASILIVICIGRACFLWNEFNRPESALVEECALKLSDTMTLENSEKLKITDSLIAEYKPKDYSVAHDKQIEVTVIQDEKPTDIQEIKILTAVDLADLADLEEESLVNSSLVEKSVAKMGTTTSQQIIIDSAASVSPQKLSTVPEPVVGIKAYNEYLTTNLIRPADEDCKAVTGLVSLSFFIDKNGRPYNTRIVISLCPSADWEAIRLVKEGPGWTTGESIATVNIYF
jgi:hypothetical protein